LKPGMVVAYDSATVNKVQSCSSNHIENVVRRVRTTNEFIV
jgi:hypothetical protein